MINTRIDRCGLVVADARLDLLLPAHRVAAEMLHLRSFITHDLFHAGVRAEQSNSFGEPAVRSKLTIEHRVLGLKINRTGHLLWRDAERGFGFTDLSARNPSRGFPHSCHYHLRKTSAQTCSITLSVRGRWTARAVPRPLARLYINTVLGLSQRALEKHLLKLRSWAKQAVTSTPPSQAEPASPSC